LTKAHTETDERLRFIDLTEAIIGPDGRPDWSLHRIDRLHPSQRGYHRWVSIIRPVLETDLRPA
jgi:lysophospholipase L1-like esterase